MKPRIKLLYGVYCCVGYRISLDKVVMGLGYTPALAYADWEAM